MTRLSVIRVWAVLAVVALAAGCGGGDSATAPVVPDSPRPTTLTVTPPTVELVAGATVQLRAEVRDQNASVMAGAAVTWTSSETSVATVDAAGLVTGVSAGGPVTITATSGGQSGAGPDHGPTPPCRFGGGHSARGTALDRALGTASSSHHRRRGEYPSPDGL